MSDKEKKYISLHKATQCCDYSQEYLSLRARQGELKAIKIGRNWITKREWLEDYLRKFNNNSSGEKKEQRRKEIKLVEPPSNLPIETLSNEFSIPVSINKKQPFFRFRFSFVTILILTLMISGIILVGQFSFQKVGVDHGEANATLSVLTSRESRASTIDVFRKYGEWLIDGFKSNVIKVRDFVFTPKEEIVIVEEKKEVKTEVEKPEQKEGVVMIPSSEKNKENEEKIKEAFSDEVKVEPKDEISGIITPIFREKEGQEYFYIMVPIEN